METLFPTLERPGSDRRTPAASLLVGVFFPLRASASASLLPLFFTQDHTNRTAPSGDVARRPAHVNRPPITSEECA